MSVQLRKQSAKPAQPRQPWIPEDGQLQAAAVASLDPRPEQTDPAACRCRRAALAGAGGPPGSARSTVGTQASAARPPARAHAGTRPWALDAGQCSTRSPILGAPRGDLAGEGRARCGRPS